VTRRLIWTCCGRWRGETHTNQPAPQRRKRRQLPQPRPCTGLDPPARCLRPPKQHRRRPRQHHLPTSRPLLGIPSHRINHLPRTRHSTDGHNHDLALPRQPTSLTVHASYQCHPGSLTANSTRSKAFRGRPEGRWSDSFLPTAPTAPRRWRARLGWGPSPPARPCTGAGVPPDVGAALTHDRPVFQVAGGTRPICELGCPGALRPPVGSSSRCWVVTRGVGASYASYGPGPVSTSRG
jgi:hypothetical protein